MRSLRAVVLSDGRQEMGPNVVANDHRNGRLTHAVHSGECFPSNATCGLCPDGTHIRFRQFRQTMLRATIDLYQQYLVFVNVVLAARDEFKILYARIALVSIFMVVLITEWAWADESSRDEHVDQPSKDYAAFQAQLDTRVITSASPEVWADSQMRQASHVALIAHFILRTFGNGSPFFHALIVPRFDYIEAGFMR